ncbi:MAG TPA: 1-(5-phosphoribosyl)-5-[(5-phosphoribosylamino)methylideneamino]imidazole-4-carboxamide isomerase [Candidatus Enterenecus avicola]|nr:1-(5-phosphoribosyl)-5-[(5-phosphoribosylamino)methylideneamino]imidazole-4-carboxamide isomerase [Candidatus Enterenecus avicola]
MIILPAIDLKDGAVVRLYKGSFDTVHQVASDPVTVARAFQEAGAKWMHMVDLDGARDGVRRNADLVRAVSDLGLQVELGGGIRSMADLEAVFALGVTRAVIGSAAVSNPDLVAQAIAAYGADRIAVGIDARDGKVKTSGWEVDSGLDFLEFAQSMVNLGVKKIIFTDIETDGMLSGPSFGRLRELQQAVSCDLIASGGVSCNRDIVELEKMGLYGAIIGKAYYTGAIDLAQAVKDGGAQC